MLDLPGKEVVILQDFVYDEPDDLLLPYRPFMLWLEGDNFWIPTPKNTHTKDIRYTGRAPIFASGGSRLIVTQRGRFDRRKTTMMDKRWDCIEFRNPIPAERVQDGVEACGACFAKLILPQA